MPSLAKVSRRLVEGGTTVGQQRASSLPRIENRLLDVRLTSLNDETVLRARAAGLEVVDADFRHARLYGRCPDLTCLAAVAAIPQVTVVHPNYGATTSAGNVTSQGDTAIRAALARQTFGVDGSGVRVGLLSDTLSERLGGRRTFEGNGCERTFLADDEAVRAELPADLNIIDEPPSSILWVDEGRAMAEIVHDLAPGASISFHTAFPNPSTFARGIDRLVECGSDIIVDDVIYFVEPMFQDGVIAQAATRAVDNGAVFFSAIGNLGTYGITDSYRDSNPVDDRETPPSGNDLHRFRNGGNTITVTVPPRCGLILVLQWNEPFSGVLGPGASSDLDFLCLRKRRTAAWLRSFGRRYRRHFARNTRVQPQRRRPRRRPDRNPRYLAERRRDDLSHRD